MTRLNLIDPSKSDISYSISKFPDGEIQISLGEINRKDYIRVYCRITKAEELFILMQVADILNRQGVEWYLNIYYLMGARMDRVMDFNRPFTLKVIGDIIKNMGATSVQILDPHSEASFRLCDGGCMFINDEDNKYHDLDPDLYEVYREYQVVFPDHGASERYGVHRGDDIVVANKVRNPETGKIESIEITNPELFKNNNKPLMVVDDLCDAGGTFVGLAKEIRKYTDKELNIFVTHMVNRKGIKNLAENYDHVYFTNSYEDWKGVLADFGDSLPDNCTQIDVIVDAGD